MTFAVFVSEECELGACVISQDLPMFKLVDLFELAHIFNVGILANVAFNLKMCRNRLYVLGILLFKLVSDLISEIAIIAAGAIAANSFASSECCD